MFLVVTEKSLSIHEPKKLLPNWNGGVFGIIFIRKLCVLA